MSETLSVLEPATEEVLQTLPRAGVDETDEAVARATEALPAWRALAPGARAGILRDVTAAMEDAHEELALLEARNAGKPIEAARGEIGGAIATFRYFSAAPERLLGDTIPVDGGVAMTFREPIGVVGLITPWNFPLAIASWKLAPALAAGNTVVLKPAELTPLTAVRFAEIAAQAGLPDGVVNVVVGPGRTCGQRLVEHPGVGKIAFTGSTEVGASIAALGRRDDQARHPGARRQVREHRVRRRRRARPPRRPRRGRSSTTPGRTAARARASSSRRARSTTSSPPSSRSSARSASATRWTRRPRWGRSSPPGSGRASPRSCPRARRSRSAAASPTGPATGSRRPCCTPSAPDERAVTEEIFGPVACVIPFTDEAEAIRLANDTIYGLSGSVWTRDGARALRVARAVEAGNLSINSNSSVRVTTPFGGFKQSGYGRELGPHATDAYTEVKTVYYRTQED